MIVTEKDGEIRNWINKNKDKHKWVTHTMLDLYAKHYHQEQVKKLNIDDVSSSTEFKVWDDLFGILAWKFKATKSGDMYLDGEAVYNELKDKFDLRRK